MNRRSLIALGCVVGLAVPSLGVAEEQLGKLGSALKRAQQFKDVEMSEAEEAQLGAEVSTRIRARYGVVQDQAAHRYVSLVGMALVTASIADRRSMTRSTWRSSITRMGRGWFRYRS